MMRGDARQRNKRVLLAVMALSLVAGCAPQQVAYMQDQVRTKWLHLPPQSTAATSTAPAPGAGSPRPSSQPDAVAHWEKVTVKGASCSMYVSSPATITYSWTGGCANQHLSGIGALTSYGADGQTIDVLRGRMYDGQFQGPVTRTARIFGSMRTIMFYEKNGKIMGSAKGADGLTIGSIGDIGDVTFDSFPPQISEAEARRIAAPLQQTAASQKGLVIRNEYGDVFPFLNVAVGSYLRNNLEDCAHARSAASTQHGNYGGAGVQCWSKASDGSYLILSPPDLGFDYVLQGYLDEEGKAYRYIFSVGDTGVSGRTNDSVDDMFRLASSLGHAYLGGGSNVDREQLEQIFVGKYGTPTRKNGDVWAWKFDEFSITLNLRKQLAVVQDDNRVAELARRSGIDQRNRQQKSVQNAIQKF